MGSPAEVDLSKRVDSVGVDRVEQAGQLHAVPDRDGQGLEQGTSYRPLSRQRLYDRGQLGPVQREQRPGDQLVTRPPSVDGSSDQREPAGRPAMR